MPQITQIKSQKKSGRVNVYLDGKFAFGIDLDNLVKFDLRVEKELTNEQIEKIVKEAEFVKTFNKLLNFAVVRPRSEKEVIDWFRRKKVHESLHKKLVSKLKKFEYLDDAKFATWWVEQRQAFRPRSLRLLISELRMKGIDKNTIDDVLAAADIDEYEVAKKLLKKKSYKWNRCDKTEGKRKKGAYLARNGFAWDIIKKVVE